MQANGGRNEELDPGMERGGWARPLFDDQAMAYVQDVYQRADAFLFGRRTYELFAGYWGIRSGDPISDALNERPKHVASTTRTDPQRADTTVLYGTLRRPWASSKLCQPGFRRAVGLAAAIAGLRLTGISAERGGS
jgi:dihydrofolate reductase